MMSQNYGNWHGIELMRSCQVYVMKFSSLMSQVCLSFLMLFAIWRNPVSFVTWWRAACEGVVKILNDVHLPLYSRTFNYQCKILNLAVMMASVFMHCWCLRSSFCCQIDRRSAINRNITMPAPRPVPLMTYRLSNRYLFNHIQSRHRQVAPAVRWQQPWCRLQLNWSTALTVGKSYGNIICLPCGWDRDFGGIAHFLCIISQNLSA